MSVRTYKIQCCPKLRNLKGYFKVQTEIVFEKFKKKLKNINKKKFGQFLNDRI